MKIRQVCLACNGKGEVQTPDGASGTGCPACQGAGSVAVNDWPWCLCPACEGYRGAPDGSDCKACKGLGWLTTCPAANAGVTRA